MDVYVTSWQWGNDASLILLSQLLIQPLEVTVHNMRIVANQVSQYDKQLKPEFLDYRHPRVTNIVRQKLTTRLFLSSATTLATTSLRIPKGAVVGKSEKEEVVGSVEEEVTKCRGEYIMTRPLHASA